MTMLQVLKRAKIQWKMNSPLQINNKPPEKFRLVIPLPPHRRLITKVRMAAKEKLAPEHMTRNTVTMREGLANVARKSTDAAARLHQHPVLAPTLHTRHQGSVREEGEATKADPGGPQDQRAPSDTPDMTSTRGATGTTAHPLPPHPMTPPATQTLHMDGNLESTMTLPSQSSWIHSPKQCKD